MTEQEFTDYIKKHLAEAARKANINEEQERQKAFQKKISEKEMKAQKLLFNILLFTSIAVTAYSIISKTIPYLKLQIPFDFYIIGYALLIVVALIIYAIYLKSIGNVKIKKKIFFKVYTLKYLKNPFGLIIVLINFGFSGFRNIFFSQFQEYIFVILFTILFVASNVASISVFYDWFYQKFFTSLKVERISNEEHGILVLKSAFLSLLLYVGLVSPFYLGVIEPGIYKGSIEPEPYKIDHIYVEELKEGVADRQIGRQYYLEGRRSQNLGTIEGFNTALIFYRKSLELIPEFSTVYAEIAYSYASLGRINFTELQNTNKASDYYSKAKLVIDSAMNITSQNPTVTAVSSILAYFSGNRKDAIDFLTKTRDNAKLYGYSDKVILAMAFLEKRDIDKVKYFKAILEVEPDNAEILNFLGMAYYKIGNEGKAKEYFERTIRLSPKYIEASINMGLVNSDKEKIYADIIQRESEFQQVAKEYLTVYLIQKYLRLFYLILLLLIIIRVLYNSVKIYDINTGLMRTEKVQKVLKMYRIFVLICLAAFIITYLSFEGYIHFVNPINTFGHLFAVKFPFF
jgi:tetratricopeptide (TPR) repeat protein